MNLGKAFLGRKFVPLAFLAAPLLLIALLSLQSFSCEEELEGGMDGPMTFEVEFVSGDAGSQGDRLSFTHEDWNFTVDIRAVDSDGDVADWFDGWVHLAVAPNGSLAHRQAEWIELTNGRAKNIDIKLQYLHSNTQLWIEDIGCDDISCGDENYCQPKSPCCNCCPGTTKVGSYATGLSPTIWVENPTLRMIQEPDGLRDVPLLGEFADVQIGNRTVVVTGVTNDGFYVTDVSEPEGIYNGMYVYSHSRPSDVVEGDLLTRLTGQVDLYYGFTELGFPSWKVGGHDESKIPAPVPIAYDDVIDDDIMARYVSRPVRVENVTVCDPDATGNEYETFGQWPVVLPGGVCPTANDRWGDGMIKIVSSATAPEYEPREMIGQTIDYIEGNLRYHISAGWMIYTRDAGDLGGEGGDDGNY